MRNRGLCVVSTLFLEQPGHEDHIGGTAIPTKTTLGFRQNYIYNGAEGAGEEDAGKNLTGHCQKKNSAVVATVRYVSLSLKHHDDFRVSPLLGKKS